MAPIHPPRASGSAPAARPTPLGSRLGKERMSVRVAVRWVASARCWPEPWIIAATAGLAAVAQRTPTSMHRWFGTRAQLARRKPRFAWWS